MRLFTAIAPAILALSIATPALADGTMTMTGKGEVRSAPDMATITTGVTTQAETAREALDANSAAMDDLVAALREAGLESRDIQTSNFTVSPRYVYSDQRDESGYTRPPRITGYEVSNAVTIIVRDLDNLGPVLDRAVTVGANTINGISFSIEDPTTLYNEARRRAVADAQAKAQVYADAAGVRLDDIESITENPVSDGPRPMYRAATMEMAADSAVPIEAGEMTYTINTTITWSIDD